MTEAGLKAACPEYSQYFGTSADGLDDCAIRQLAVGAPQPTATCCGAASDFVASGSCGQNEIVSEFPLLLLHLDMHVHTSDASMCMLTSLPMLFTRRNTLCI